MEISHLINTIFSELLDGASFNLTTMDERTVQIRILHNKKSPLLEYEMKFFISNGSRGYLTDALTWLNDYFTANNGVYSRDESIMRAWVECISGMEPVGRSKKLLYLTRDEMMSVTEQVFDHDVEFESAVQCFI